VLVRVRPGAPNPLAPLRGRLARLSRVGGARAALDFTHSLDASSSRRLILRMEDAARLARAQTLR